MPSFSSRRSGPHVARGIRHVALVLTALLTPAAPAVAWDAATHRWIAQVAWSQLTPTTRQQVTELIAAHPDAALLDVRATGRPADSGAARFAELSVWPDLIRDDPRYADTPGPLLDASPDPAADRSRHRDWHYLNRPIGPGQAYASTADGRLDAALTGAARVLGDPGRPAAARAVALGWFAHLVGDAHQPLHVVSWFTATGDSDRGGNRVWVRRPRASATALATPGPAIRLHAFWDGAARPLPGIAEAVAHAADDDPAPAQAAMANWLAEGQMLAEQSAYPATVALDAPPILLQPEFVADATRLARQRIRVAAARLAARLNAILDGAGGGIEGGR